MVQLLPGTGTNFRDTSGALQAGGNLGLGVERNRLAREQLDLSKILAGLRAFQQGVGAVGQARERNAARAERKEVRDEAIAFASATSGIDIGAVVRGEKSPEEVHREAKQAGIDIEVETVRAMADTTNELLPTRTLAEGQAKIDLLKQLASHTPDPEGVFQDMIAAEVERNASPLREGRKTDAVIENIEASTQQSQASTEATRSATRRDEAREPLRLESMALDNALKRFEKEELNPLRLQSMQAKLELEGDKDFAKKLKQLQLSKLTAEIRSINSRLDPADAALYEGRVRVILQEMMGSVRALDSVADQTKTLSEQLAVATDENRPAIKAELKALGLTRDNILGRLSQHRKAVTQAPIRGEAAEVLRKTTKPAGESDTERAKREMEEESK